ncbi:MAG: ROK family protein [Thermodesulfobacteriota bacterium]
MSAIVIDLGGTHLRCAVSDETGQITPHSLQKERLGSFIRKRSANLVWDEIISSLVNFTDRVRPRVSPQAPIVISFPGPVKHPSTILDAPTVIGAGAKMRDLAAELNKLTGRKIYIINDISAAAWYFSGLVRANRFMVVTISSGIGSKIFDRAHPLGVLDDVPYAGEIGHATIDPDPEAPQCDCGGKGHLGAISSGRGVERFARRAALQQPELFAKSACFTKLGASPHTITNEDHLVPAAKFFDPWALSVIRECTLPLSRMLLSLTLAVGLEKVIIIGGFALALGEVYLEILQTALAESSDYQVVAPYLGELITMGDYKEEACLEGAAIYAQRLALLNSGK